MPGKVFLRRIAYWAVGEKLVADTIPACQGWLEGGRRVKHPCRWFGPKWSGSP